MHSGNYCRDLLSGTFCGSGSVSLYAKAKGYKVISNDIAYRSLIIGKAIIANNSAKLESEDLARLFVKTKHDEFIKKNYCPKVFTTKIADFLDNAVAAAHHVENETKRYLLLHLLIKFILSCRQFGKFTLNIAFGQSKYYESKLLLIQTFLQKRSVPKKSLARTCFLAKKQFVPPSAGLRIRLGKWGEISGTRFARPTFWLLQNL
jgi:adenine-specific DNA methylase